MSIVTNIVLWTFAIFGLAMGIGLIVAAFKDRCKGFYFKHKRLYVAITRPNGRCGCSGNGHDYKVRWICTRCHTMTEECVLRDGDWKVDGGELKPDFERFSKVG